MKRIKLFPQHIFRFGISKIQRSPKNNFVREQIEQCGDRRNGANNHCTFEGGSTFTEQNPDCEDAGRKNHCGTNPNCQGKQESDSDGVLVVHSPSVKGKEIYRCHHDQSAKGFRKEISRIWKNQSAKGNAQCGDQRSSCRNTKCRERQGEECHRPSRCKSAAEHRAEYLNVKDHFRRARNSGQVCQQKFPCHHRRYRGERLTRRIGSSRLSVAVECSVEIPELHRLRNRRRAALDQALRLEKWHVFIRRSDPAGGGKRIDATKTDKQPACRTQRQAVALGDFGVGRGLAHGNKQGSRVAATPLSVRLNQAYY